MADQKELDELKQRIALLCWDNHLDLFELVLADHRRAHVTDDAGQELATQEARHLQQQQAADHADKRDSSNGA